MEKLITSNSNALRFLITEDIYKIRGEKTAEPVSVPEPVKDLAPPIADALPEEPEVKTPVAAAEPASFNYLGENNRYFLILLEDKLHLHLNSSHKEMLMKIMKAKGLELRDLAIVNLAQYPSARFSELKAFFSCSKLALFGIDPLKIGLPPIASNTPSKHTDVNILASFSLDEMNTSTDKKREFWAIMKDF